MIRKVNPDLYRRVQIQITGPTINVDLVYKKSGLLHTPVFRFQAGTPTLVLSYDRVTREWMDTWVTWSGPRKGDLENPWRIPVDCKDSAGFKWTAVLQEFLDPFLFTTKDYIM